MVTPETFTDLTRQAAREMWRVANDPAEKSWDFWFAGEKYVHSILSGLAAAQCWPEPLLEAYRKLYETVSPATQAEYIRKLAYLIWESNANLVGTAQDFWVAAEKNVLTLTRSTIGSAPSLYHAQEALAQAFALNDLDMRRATSEWSLLVGTLPINYENLEAYSIIADSNLLGEDRAYRALDTAPQVQFQLYRALDTAPQVQFQFRLEGEQVRSNAVLADGDADLSFFLGPEASDAIARVRGTKLDEALKKGGKIGVLLAPVGYWLRDGECHQVALIRDGELDRELVFRLKAGSASNPHAGAWIYLDLDGIAIRAFFVELPIVEDLANAPGAPVGVPTIDLDLVGEPVLARLCITQDAGELTISYHNSATGFCSQKRLRALTLSTLTTSLGEVQDLARKAAVSFLWREVTDWFGHAATPAQQRQLAELTQQVARAGWTLWAHLTQDDDLAPALRDINRLAPGSRIEIVTDSVFVPWEIVYPDNPAVLGTEDPCQVVKPQLFWGDRYILASTLSETRNIAAEKRVHAAGPVETVLCLSPAIDGDFAGVFPLPAASHKPWAEKAQARMKVVLQEDPGQTRRMLLRERQVPKWIYLFCHGHGGATDALELGGGDEFVLRSTDLQNTARFNGRPIVFLNSCSSGAHAPLSLTNFYQAMRVDKEALGIIGTSFPVPATIAAAIGQRLSDLYLGGDDLGMALFKVRRELMEASVPIGLFYTLHAPADARALRTG